MEQTSQDMQRYYDKYWSEHKASLNAHEIIRLGEILKAITLFSEKFNRPLRICDMGSGRGWLSNELTRFGSVVAVDLSEAGVALARQRWPSIDFRCADITQWRPDEAFDLVVSSEVLEHVPDQAKFAATLQYLLREGGHVVLTTPNRRQQKTWDRASNGRQAVEQWLTPGELRRLLAAFKPIAHWTFIFDFSYVGLARIASAPKLLSGLQRLGLKNLYDGIRHGLNIGLYQIFVGRYVPQKP